MKGQFHIKIVLELKQIISGSDFHLKFNNAWMFCQFFNFRNQQIVKNFKFQLLRTMNVYYL